LFLSCHEDFVDFWKIGKLKNWNFRNFRNFGKLKIEIDGLTVQGLYVSMGKAVRVD